MKQIEKIIQCTDEYLTKYVLKEIELIKILLNIPTKDDIYFLGYSKGLNCFLYKNKVIISAHNCEKEKNNKFIVDSMTISGLYVITLLKEYPHTSEEVIFETIKQGDYTYDVEDFLNWIDIPSTINIDIDLP